MFYPYPCESGADEEIQLDKDCICDVERTPAAAETVLKVTHFSIFPENEDENRTSSLIFELFCPWSSVELSEEPLTSSPEVNHETLRRGFAFSVFSVVGVACESACRSCDLMLAALMKCHLGLCAVWCSCVGLVHAWPAASPRLQQMKTQTGGNVLFSLCEASWVL